MNLSCFSPHTHTHEYNHVISGISSAGGSDVVAFVLVGVLASLGFGYLSNTRTPDINHSTHATMSALAP